MDYSITTTNPENKWNFKVFVSFDFEDRIFHEWVNQNDSDFFAAVTVYKILEREPNRFRSQGDRLLVEFTRRTPRTIKTFYKMKDAKRFTEANILNK